MWHLMNSQGSFLQSLKRYRSEVWIIFLLCAFVFLCLCHPSLLSLLLSTLEHPVWLSWIFNSPVVNLRDSADWITTCKKTVQHQTTFVLTCSELTLDLELCSALTSNDFSGHVLTASAGDSGSLFAIQIYFRLRNLLLFVLFWNIFSKS